MPASSASASIASAMKRLITARPRFNHRGTLRDLYVSGLVSVFRRHSIFRIWEPLRETPRRTTSDELAG